MVRLADFTIYLVDEEFKKLLSESYKIFTEKDWKSGMKTSTTGTSTTAPPTTAASSNETELLVRIASQCNTVRQLKTDKADKEKLMKSKSF